jgi:hypothetical protein
VRTDGLPGQYPATVRLGRAELFDDGWAPMLDATTMATLLVDLAQLGDEAHQLARLGWALRAADGGRIELVETTLPAEDLDMVDGRWLLPRECGFTPVDELEPLAQVYRSATLLEAHAYGPSDQLADPTAVLAEARIAAHALGTLLGALIGLAVDTDADTARTALTDAAGVGATSERDGAATPVRLSRDDEDADIAVIRAIRNGLLAAAADVVTFYRPAR